MDVDNLLYDLDAENNEFLRRKGAANVHQCAEIIARALLFQFLLSISEMPHLMR